MIELRITKYNPKHRDSNGAYLGDDWTSACDIGKTDSEGLVTPQRYMAIEDAYVQAALLFLKAYGVDSMKIEYLERHRVLDLPMGCEKENEAWLDEVALGKQLSHEGLDRLIRLNLREACWTRLRGARNSYIHFGYDYYMYIGIDVERSQMIPLSFPDSVYGEDFPSPHHEVDIDFGE